EIVEIMATGRLRCGDHGTLGIAVELVEQKDQRTFLVVRSVTVEDLTSAESASRHHSQILGQGLQTVFDGQLGGRGVNEDNLRLRELGSGRLDLLQEHALPHTSATKNDSAPAAAQTRQNRSQLSTRDCDQRCIALPVVRVHSGTA